MKRGLTACAGWAAFAGVLWMWSTGARPEAPIGPVSMGAPAVAASPVAQSGARREVTARVEAIMAHGQPRAWVMEPTQMPWREENSPVKARFRVTLETLSDAAAVRDQRPGEDVALAIQWAASRAGRNTWFTADWTGDGKLDGADIAAFVGAYRSGLKAADLNHDGVVDERDFAEFIREFRVAESRPVRLFSTQG
jgi:hypothetical protein